MTTRLQRVRRNRVLRSLLLLAVGVAAMWWPALIPVLVMFGASWVHHWQDVLRWYRTGKRDGKMEAAAKLRATLVAKIKASDVSVQDVTGE